MTLAGPLGEHPGSIVLVFFDSISRLFSLTRDKVPVTLFPLVLPKLGISLLESCNS